MSIHITKPYKIVPSKHKRYGSHYNIPADRALVVPMKMLGTEVSCDVRWEDDNGEHKILQNIVFVSDYLVPLNVFIDQQLHELWQHYYGPKEA
jgi:hypothetical protein